MNLGFEKMSPVSQAEQMGGSPERVLAYGSKEFHLVVHTEEEAGCLGYDAGSEDEEGR